jgi:hypothetical protein
MIVPNAGKDDQGDDWFAFGSRCGIVGTAVCRAASLVVSHDAPAPRLTERHRAGQGRCKVRRPHVPLRGREWTHFLLHERGGRGRVGSLFCAALGPWHAARCNGRTVSLAASSAAPAAPGAMVCTGALTHDARGAGRLRQGSRLVARLGHWKTAATEWWSCDTARAQVQFNNFLWHRSRLHRYVSRLPLALPAAAAAAAQLSPTTLTSLHAFMLGV